MTITLADGVVRPEDLLRQAQELLAQGRAHAAIGEFRRVIALAPTLGIAELGLAVACGQCGDDAAAERAARKAIGKGYDNAGARYVLARSLFGQRRHDEADAAFRHVLQLEPSHMPALAGLGESVWQRTGDADLAATTIATIAPIHPPELVLLLAKLARQARGHAGELGMLEQELERAPASLALRLGAARAAMFCAPARALDHALTAVRAAPRDKGAYALYGDALLANGRAADAAAVAAQLLQVDGHDGHALALQASAWRLSGDPRYRELYDYTRFVHAQPIDTPAGWADLPAYLRDLSRCLRGMHGARFHPLDQTLQGGSQIELYPEHAQDPALRAFAQAIAGPIDRYLRMLGPGADALRRRNQGRWRCNGMWSVLLRANGFHFNHFHGQGWISSACYIDLPESIGTGNGDGWIKFGEPVLPTTALGAEYFVKPEPGLLVLFPSWMWHGTVPFAGTAQATRLTIAFDIVPA
ncbi:MAG: hypothetical protein JSR27_11500 [Proteobacteria bacterium]|nr:hypothetical protein [Pseudomonadota bacterium]